jgi:prepilin-type N-terminal cleavage/methylation domain-containing protein
MKKNGFTMIELLVTFVILGIVSAIAIPGFARWYPGYRLKNASRDLYSNMQLAKMGAVRNNGEWAIFFNAGGGSYQVISGGADGDYSTAGDNIIEKTITLADYESGVSYGHGSATAPIGSAFGDEITFNANTVVFNPRSMINSITGGYVYLQNNKNNTYAVGALGTGVILMRSWTGTAWQ